MSDKMYTNKLKPGSAFSYFKHTTFDSWPGIGGNGFLSGKVDIYVYPTVATPTDREEWKKNGRLVIIQVFRGQIKPRTDGHEVKLVGRIVDKQYNVYDFNGVRLPPLGSGVDPGSGKLKYIIEFAQTMPMFQSQVPVDFEALYEEEFYHDKDVVFSPNDQGFMFKGRSSNNNDYALLGVTTLPAGTSGERLEIAFNRYDHDGMLGQSFFLHLDPIFD